MAREAGRHTCHRRSWVKGCRCHCAWQAIDKGPVSKCFFEEKIFSWIDSRRAIEIEKEYMQIISVSLTFFNKRKRSAEKEWNKLFHTCCKNIPFLENSNSIERIRRFVLNWKCKDKYSIFKNCWKSNRNVICRKKLIWLGGRCVYTPVFLFNQFHNWWNGWSAK